MVFQKLYGLILFFRNKTSTSILNFLKIELERQRQKTLILILNLSVVIYKQYLFYNCQIYM